MRIFFTISLEGLDKYSLDTVKAHAVTDGLRRAFPDDDDDELAMIALLAAADDNIRDGGDEPFRLVLAADADTSQQDTDDPSLVEVAAPVLWSDVAAIFVDDDDVRDDVLAARWGDDDAFDRLAGHDMLWYDPTERIRLAVELRDRIGRQH